MNGDILLHVMAPGQPVFKGRSPGVPDIGEEYTITNADGKFMLSGIVYKRKWFARCFEGDDERARLHENFFECAIFLKEAGAPKPIEHKQENF